MGPFEIGPFEKFSPSNSISSQMWSRERDVHLTAPETSPMSEFYSSAA